MIRLTLDAAWRRMDKIPKFQEKINSAGRGRAASSQAVVLIVAVDDETRGRKRRVSVGGLRRIDVDHDVFDNWKLFLNRFVNVSRDGMRLEKRHIAVDGDFRLDENAGAEFSGPDEVEPIDAGNRENELAHFSFSRVVARRVDHLRRRAAQDFKRNPQNETADDDRRKRV